MPRVLNYYKCGGIPDGAVNIMRPTKWGNPFNITPECDRDQAISKFMEYVFSKPGFADEIKASLRGKDLVCCCAPKFCHGDILIVIANS